MRIVLTPLRLNSPASLVTNGMTKLLSQILDKPARTSNAAAHVAEARTQLSKTRFLARAWSETVEHCTRAPLAAAFAHRALASLASASATGPQAQTNLAGGELDATAKNIADSIGASAAVLPRQEGLHVVTSLYPALMPEADRSAQGAFYTPPALSSRLLDQASEQGVDWRKARILDPAAGGGAFLIQTISRMRNALGDCEPAFVLAQVASRLLGLERDPNAAALAQAAVDIALQDLSIASGRQVPRIVRVCDTLIEPPDESFDLVIGNPPYGRVTLTSDQRRRYARSLFGHANLYGVFTDAALRWTKSGGLIAYLTPTSFLAGQYFAALRGLLAREAPPVAIDLVHARKGVFEDVQQETVLATYRKGERAGRARVSYLKVTSELNAIVERNGSIGLPRRPGEPWLAPRSSSHRNLIARAERMPNRLLDWGYSVSTGPLVWNRFKDQLCQHSNGSSVYPLIWAEAITPDGRFIFRALKKNHSPYFRLGERDAWLLSRQACVLVQRTTAKEQARRIIAAELPADFVNEHRGVVIENHLNMVRARGAAQVPLSVVATILNSNVVDQVFRCMSGSVAVSSFELSALPLPAAGQLTRLSQLVAGGAARVEVDSECNRLYGIGS